MIDFHSHILPKTDDGSRNTDESIAMLGMEQNQNIDAVFLTPHFYAESESPSSFLERRNHSFAKIKECYSGLPLFLGAEVAFFIGMSHAEELPLLSLAGSEYILIEMPFCRWSSVEIEEIFGIMEEHNLKPILAHIERYLPFGNKRWIKYLSGVEGVFLQSNAEFFIEKKTRRKALRFLKKGYIDIIGSDAHSLHRRPPNLSFARDIIEKKDKELLAEIERKEKIIKEAVK